MPELYFCFAKVILYSPSKLPARQYNLRSKYNWRSQYNSPKANITEKNGNRITITVLFCIWANILIETPKGVQIPHFRGVHHFEKGVHFLYPGGCIPLKIHRKCKLLFIQTPH